MTANRSGGLQVPDPSRFPDFAGMIAQIHARGVRFGLYTSRSNKTCAGFAASCGYESADAAFYARLGVDYVKVDSCGSCRAVLDDYAIFQEAIWATGREMVLSIEGEPPVANCSAGGFGNMRRVGHDLVDYFKSAVSLVDIASGLWPFAHPPASGANASKNGFWNDVEILHVGKKEFANGSIAAVAHFALWCALKAPLLLGMNLSAIDNATLAIVGNAEAIAVNQDPLGIPARRVAVAAPRNATVAASPWDSVAIVSPCARQAPTQTWNYRNSSAAGAPRAFLFVAPCDAADPFQAWAFPGAGSDGGGGGAPGLLRNLGAGTCLDAAAGADPAQLARCDAASPTQAWTLTRDGRHISNAANTSCVAIFASVGPDAQIAYCKPPGTPASNEAFTYDPATARLVALSPPVAGQCLAALAGPPGGQLVTVTAEGAQLCLADAFGDEGGWTGAPCAPAHGGGGRANGAQFFNATLAGDGASGLVALTGSPGPAFNNQPYASGPLPHTRYVTGAGGGASGTGLIWRASDARGLLNGSGSQLALQARGIVDDDLVGNVTLSDEPFCLDVSTLGLLEVWAGPLVGGRLAVLLFNRSPADDDITARWADIGARDGAAYAVRDVMAGADRGTFTGAYTSAVAAHGVVFLVLSPA